MRSELMKRVPELAKYMQPKCGERRMGYCDEDVKAYEACPLSAARPHKLQVIEVFKRVRAESGKPMRDLGEDDLRAAESFREPAKPA
jgi:thymidylate synthase (FAD)